VRIDPEQEVFAKCFLDLGNKNLPKNDFKEIESPEVIISSGNLIGEYLEIVLQIKITMERKKSLF
jgi:hypothetical protein